MANTQEKPSKTSAGSIEQLAINTIRTLSMDAVEAAKSGHPGTPMAMAPVAYALWNDVLRYDPADPRWPGRDRFVLSCGHASMLLYSMLHLCGVKRVVDGKLTDELSVPMDEIRRFRQLHSRCPGHPEQYETTGVETTTGPLGQGFGNSVGMAIAQRWLAAHFNRPGFDLFDYNIYALCSDGDLMEGDQQRSRVAGRTFEAVEPVLDLRRQSHHDRRAHHAGLQRRRRPAVRGPGLERREGGRRQRPGRAAKGVSNLRPHERPAHDDHRPLDHRLGRSAQARHSRGPRLAAGRRGNPRNEDRLRLAPRRAVSRAARSAQTFRRRHRRPGPQAA